MTSSSDSKMEIFPSLNLDWLTLDWLTLLCWWWCLWWWMWRRVLILLEMLLYKAEEISNANGVHVRVRLRPTDRFRTAATPTHNDDDRHDKDCRQRANHSSHGMTERNRFSRA